MESSPSSTFDLVIALHGRSDRGERARTLAQRLGVDELLFFVKDPTLGALLPAPGFAQTLRGGRSWHTFLSRCSSAGVHTGEVELPRGHHRCARAIACSQGVTAVLLGGEPITAEVAVLEAALPLLGALFQAEQAELLAVAQASDARDAAQRAHALASALEGARAESAKLNAELQEEHRRKDDFLAMLAHELRNPLAPLVLSVDLLRRGGSDELGHHLEIMSRQVTQMSRLVEDLLDVSRVSRGRIELRRERLDVRDVLEEALEANRPALEARRHHVEVEVPDRPLCVDADRARLTQVFANLLNNAAKYTDPGGHLELTAKQDGESVVVALRDNGVGISAELLPYVFDLFSQAPVTLDRSAGGLGIGLTLVRTLVELHGGQVEAQSTGVGAGSTFTVRFPVASDRVLSAVPLGHPLQSSRDEPRCPAIVDAPTALHIFVIDDNEDAADTLADMLRFLGHHVDVAYSGVTALQVVDTLAPDLIILDIGLPELDGYEVARRLRKVMHQDFWLVALTGYGTSDDKRRACEAGFDEHVAKPVTTAKLSAITTRVCQRKASRAASAR